jgi:hypothetical protein
MPVSEKVVDQIRDSKTIGRSIIAFVNGILCIVLVVISGTSDVDSASDAVNLRNLSVGFGATVAILNLLLTLIIEVLISACSSNAEDEQMLKELFSADPKLSPDQSIIEGTQIMLSILNQMKIAGKNLNDNSVNKQDEFKIQLKALENALNNFGTIV